MDQNEKGKNEKAKDTFQNFWKKTSDIGKKAAEGAKAFATQTKKNIHDAQAKKYTPVTAKDFKSKDFNMPNIVEIVDDSANRNFINCDGAIGWIEKHDGTEVLHMYFDFVKKCNLEFIPVPQRDNVYCKDNFDFKKFINANQIFEKATEEKLAELEHIAYSLGAKTCSVEIIETDCDIKSKGMSLKTTASVSTDISAKNKKLQSGKNISCFQGSSTPKTPTLKWFAHDDNIRRLIEMRCTDSSSIKSKILELKGSSSVVISQKIACAVDSIKGIKGGLSMESQVIKEHSNMLVYEIEF